MQFQQISENIVFYKIFNTCAIAGYTLYYDANVKDCDSLEWYSTKALYSRIKECYPNIVMLQGRQSLDDFYFMISWCLACFLCSLFGLLAQWLVRKDKSLVLSDNNPFLSLHDITKDTYLTQFGAEKKLGEFVNSERLNEAVAEQKLSTNFEKKVVDFKSANGNRGFRKLKNKLKMPEFSEMFYYQCVWKPLVFRWIFLGLSIVFFGFSLFMVIFYQDYNSEAEWVLARNYNSFGWVRFSMIIVIVVWGVLDDFLMIWFNFIKSKTMYEEKSRLISLTKYVKWVMGGLAWFQFKYFDFNKFWDFKDLRMYWSLAC